ncbi:hypothetical protein B0H16DRAFT_872959 [Mycena metata]|uniref:Uncharacterized protein n=1 Tax=Mycena metata TaxID=1033252 RepID=A0AAD7N7W6_9AGAR|nr:hypothetical protein B0H16DRAFT_872959 [Mycena metata]
MLQNLGQLKAALVERYERYVRSPAANAEAIPAIKVAMQNPPAQAQPPVRRASQAQHAQAQRVVAEEAARWRVQREEATQRDAAFVQSQNSQNPYGGPAPISTAGGYTSSASSSAAAQNATYPSPTAYLSSASAAAAARGPAPAPIPVSLVSGGASSVAQQHFETVPPSFGRGASAPNINTNYPSSAGVSFPAPTIVYPSNNPNSNSNYSPSSASSASYSTYPTTNPTPSPGGGSYAPSYSGSVSYAPSYAGSTASSTHSTPAPGPMPLRPSGANAYEWDGESTDDERSSAPSAYRRMNFPTPGHERGLGDLSSGMARLSTADGTSARSLAPSRYIHVLEAPPCITPSYLLLTLTYSLPSSAEPHRGPPADEPRPRRLPRPRAPHVVPPAHAGLRPRRVGLGPPARRAHDVARPQQHQYHHHE